MKKSFIRQKLRYHKNVNCTVKKSPILTLWINSWEINVPISLLSKRKKQYNYYLFWHLGQIRQLILENSLFFTPIWKELLQKMISTRKQHCQLTTALFDSKHLSEAYLLCKQRDSSNICCTIFDWKTWVFVLL